VTIATSCTPGRRASRLPVSSSCGYKESRWLYFALQDTGIVGNVSVELGAGGNGLLASTGRPSLMNVQAPSFVGLLRLPAP
jgi:hypothetical protein